MSERSESTPEIIAEHGRSPATPEGRPVRSLSIPEPDSLDAESVLDCHELARVPAPVRKGRAEPVPDLLALVDRYDAFILDGYGVINLGPEPIPGIAETVGALRAAGREVMVLTNGAGRPSRHTARRYAGWGLDIPQRLVVSSRDALEAALAAQPRPGLWGVMALPDSELETLPVETAPLEDDEEIYRRAAGFIFLRSGGWNIARHMRLAQALRESPRPVLVANPDISAPYPGARYSAEPGYWALRIEAETGVRCEPYGKPFGPAFELALSRLGGAGARRERVAMVGDGLYTDIVGGLVAGLGTVLVTDHGLLKGFDWEARAARAGIFPDHVIPEA
ncbi:MAG: HAD hydrolase-like protein [Chromatiales bacterium]|nr:HAD hydrolase-like protein [Chromatiales bacterium]